MFWIILAPIVLDFWIGLRIIARQRRAGTVSSHGHPFEDALLLLASAIILVLVLGAYFWWAVGRFPSGWRRIVGYVMIASVAVALTSASKYLLRRRARGGEVN
jgi:hypothetical protein